MATNNILNNTCSRGFTASGGNINISNDAATATINLGTGAAVKTVTLGSTTTTSGTTIQSGNSGISLTHSNLAMTFNSGTGAISISTDSTNNTLNFATGAAVKTTTLGSTNTTSTTTVQSGSGALNITSTNGALTINSGTGAWGLSTDASDATVSLATGGAVKTVTLGSTNTTSTLTVAGGSNGVQINNTFLNMPTTTSTAGQLRINNDRVLHCKLSSGFNTDLFVGRNSGNFTASTSFGGITGLGYNTVTGIGSSGGAWATTGLGVNASNSVTTGLRNTGIGYGTITGVTTGAANLAVGYLAGSSWTVADHDNIAIANTGTLGDTNVGRIGAGTGTGSHQLNLSFISGIVGITTVNNNAIAVLVDSVGQLGTTSSSKRFKENIEDMGDVSSCIFSLRPTTFDFIGKSDYKKCVGLIAEEVEKVMPSLVANNQDGQPESVKYHNISVLLLNELKKLLFRIDELEKQLA